MAGAYSSRTPTAVRRAVRIAITLRSDIRASLAIPRLYLAANDLSLNAVWLRTPVSTTAIRLLGEDGSLARPGVEATAPTLAVRVFLAGSQDPLLAWALVPRVIASCDIVGLGIAEAAAPVDLYRLDGTLTLPGVPAAAARPALCVALARSGVIHRALCTCEDGN